MSRSSDTRWLYRIEDETFRFNRYATADRPIESLRRTAARVWANEAPRGRRLPEIVASEGLRWSGRLTSFCEGFSRIELARHHRTVLVLLHELTHALGPCVHGPRFVRLYFRLLHQYAGYSRWFLQGVAAGRGITL